MINEMVHQPTEETAETMWEEMNRKFAFDEQLAPVIRYLTNHTMKVSKNFLHCHVDKLKHFDTRTTGRAESAHSALKAGSRMTSRDVLGSDNQIHEYIFQQLADYKRTVDDDKSAVDRRLVNNDFFQNVVRKVPSFALNDALCSLESLDQRISECSQWNRTVNGLPCKNELVELILNDSALSLDDFDQQLWLNLPAPVLLNPLEELASMYTTADKATRSRLEQVILSGIQTAHNKYPKPKVIQHSRTSSFAPIEESATQPLSTSPRSSSTRKKRNPFTCSICGIVGHTKANKKFHP
ncbi:hypothetical protein GEMRC1_005254 [Eukaryota sp. GEM-RC1]